MYVKFGSKCLSLILGCLTIALGGVPAKAGFVQFSDANVFNTITNARLIADFEQNVFDFPEFRIRSGTAFGLTVVPSSFFVPTFPGNAVTASGNEIFNITFLTNVQSVGFDTILNDFGPATIRAFDLAGGLLGAFTRTHDANTVGFFGLSSTESIGSLQFTSISGGIVNTGIDNLRITEFPQSIPEPFTLGILGAGLLGLGAVNIRRKKLQA